MCPCDVHGGLCPVGGSGFILIEARGLAGRQDEALRHSVYLVHECLALFHGGYGVWNGDRHFIIGPPLEKTASFLLVPATPEIGNDAP